MIRKRFGQHFLAPAWADKVIAAIAPRQSDRFLEIGPGPGVLTTRLARRAGSLVAVEIDRDLAAALRTELPRTVAIIEGDFLDFDMTPWLAGGPMRVAGNVPYNISSPILFKLLRTARTSNGLVAQPGTRDYGVLTIFTGVQADATRLMTLPPGAFRPAPKVQSAVVRLQFKPLLVPDADVAVFDGMVRGMFMQRRKTLNNALRPFADSRGVNAREALAAAGIDPIRRPETLTLPELVSLAQSLNSKA